MRNKSAISGFLLSDLSVLTDSQFPLVQLILLIYLMTLTFNLVIILLINTDAELQTPMFFFLGNLSILDIGMSSIPMQVMCLFALMSYDRYVAICYPLHYISIVNKKLCAALTSRAWIFGLCYSLVHTLGTLRLTFCYTATIRGFFCELYQLIQISCSDSFINILLFYILASAVSFFVFFTISYFHVFSIILHNKCNKGRTKGFSTCISQPYCSNYLLYYGHV
ncbi:hypothetical protein XENTR_v10023526 [Xenopus tropicalis]|nr:hypothetical protein XENTR_v10023526 [Xenopus tropicalis]